jgi:hypothetical protein
MQRMGIQVRFCRIYAPIEGKIAKKSFLKASNIVMYGALAIARQGF